MAQASGDFQDSASLANVPVDGIAVANTAGNPSAGNALRVVQAIGDGGGANQLAGVDSNNNLQVSVVGQALASTTGSITTSTGTVQATITEAGVVTISIHGTYASFNAVFEASDDAGTTWYPIAGARLDGTAAESTIAGVSNTARAWDFAATAINTIRIRATALTSGTVSVKINQGGLLTDPAPVVSGTVNVLGSGGVANVPINISQVNGSNVASAGLGGNATSGNPFIVQGANGATAIPVTTDPTKASYSSTVTGSAFPVGDVLILQGSTTKTIKLRRIIISGTAGTAGTAVIQILKRSTAASGGTTGTAPSASSHDSNNSAATTSVVYYTTPPTPGTLSGTFATLRYNFLTTSVMNQPFDMDFGTAGAQAITLRGASQYLSVNVVSNGATTPAGDITLVWSEE